jgi:putative zinc finger protein
MRHIPEEELHAYLDQALSRSQCVEIESHLADCLSCRATRDGIAALRDRTTALLARLAPPRSISPSFESLRRRAADVVSARRRRVHLAAWAASLVAALGLGWSASVVLRPHQASSLAQRQPARAASAQPRVANISKPVDSAQAASGPLSARPPRARPAPSRPAPPPRSPPRESRPSTARLANNPTPAPDRTAVLSVLDPSPAPELTKLDPPRASNGNFDGMWRTMSWDGAQAEAGKALPHIDGLPVMQVQVQNAEGSRPLMVVAQQLTSGQVIQTIEGPAADVSQLLARRTMSDVDSVQLRGGDSFPGESEIDHAMAMQLGDRMIAITGDLPSDSLRAMIRRMNAEMRSK